MCLGGLANDSLVFYVAEGNIGPMIQRMLHERYRMLAAKVEWVTFAKLAKLDVANGDITPDPNVSEQIHFTKVYHTYMHYKPY